MKRGEGVALAAAAIGHLALFALLSLAWSGAPPPPPSSKPVEVSLVDAVALDQQAPPAPEPPAQSAALEQAPPEDAPPPASVPPAPVPPKAPDVAPEPAPPPPRPAAVAPARPTPRAMPAPKKPVAEKPDKPAPAPPAPARARVATPKVATQRPAASTAKAAAVTKTPGANPKASRARQTGSLLDDDFRKGLTQTLSRSKAPDAAPGATMNAQAAADIGSAIRRQVQPCADRQVNPGPGASRIVVTIRLQLNRDGSLAGRPSIADDHGGVDDENRRYVDAVDRNAIATFAGCAPLRGLPAELYDVPRGWKTFILRYKLPG